MAGVGQMPQRGGHPMQGGRFCFQRGHVRKRDGFHLAAGAGAIAPEGKQIGHLFDRESQFARVPDEA